MHQPSEAYKEEAELGTRRVELFLGGNLVCQTIITLLSDEWYLIKPSAITITDRLVVEKGTDMDSLVVQWGNMIPSALARQQGSDRIG